MADRKRKVPAISRARAIAKYYGLDQVLIIGRKIGDDGYRTMTTYGKDRKHCDHAAHLGDALMGLMTADGGHFEPLKERVRESLRAEV